MDANSSGTGRPVVPGGEIEGRIRRFLAGGILYSENGFPYPDDASFLREGVIDSLGVLDLVSFVNQEFGLQVEGNELLPENFDSVCGLAAYIRRKQGVGSRPDSATAENLSGASRQA